MAASEAVFTKTASLDVKCMMTTTFYLLLTLTSVIIPSNGVQRSCRMNDLYGPCKYGEKCVKDTRNNATAADFVGTCECLPDYHEHHESGICVKASSTGTATRHTVTIFAVVFSVCVLVLCVVAVFVTWKFRLVQRLRERCYRCRRNSGIRTYEVVSIGDEDDEPVMA